MNVKQHKPVNADAPVLRGLLRDGLANMGLTLSDAQQANLIRYTLELSRWNLAYNLTAVRAPAEMVTRHLLDSLAVMPHLVGETFLDVGTGAGLPGIPLAVAMPDCRFTLLDSNGKKTRFLVHVVGLLGLKNVTVVHGRIEQFQPPSPFSAVISRAFSSLADYVNNVHHVIAADGVIYAMKGQMIDDETGALPPGFKIRATHALGVPGLEGAQRHLLEVEAEQR